MQQAIDLSNHLHWERQLRIGAIRRTIVIVYCYKKSWIAYVEKALLNDPPPSTGEQMTGSISRCGC